MTAGGTIAPGTQGGAAASGRIAARFATLRQERRGALVTYLSAGDPDPATSRALIAALPEAGADLIEIGMPFTDPMADGPAIQRAGLRALAAGMTLAGVLDLVRDFRGRDAATPIVLMGYLNPVHAYGVARFCADAAAAGADGLIIVDVPPEESDRIAPHAAAAGLDLIRLVAPTTDDARLPLVLGASSGFVYFVAITGITGTASASAASLEAAIPRLRAHTALPIAIGFGIRTPAQAAAAVRVADAAVVGTALVETLAATLDAEGRATAATVPAVTDAVRALAAAVAGG